MRVVILGTTGSGKSTVANKLRRKYQLPVLEVDNEVSRLNNGKWPKSQTLVDKLFEKTNQYVLDTNDVIYITPYLSKENIIKFYNKGFTFIELHANIDALLKRRIKRDNPSKQEIERFTQNYQGYFEITQDPAIAKLFTKSIDTTKKTKGEVLNDILNQLEIQ